MIDIDKNLEIFYESDEDKEDEYIGAISKHECVVDRFFVIELLEEVKRLREGLREIVSDFEIKKTDKWEMLFRIETILKGVEEE
jgi:hypothetical protein